MRTSGLDELRHLSRGIQKSFVHLETRDSYGTETELPHLARWRRGEPEDYDWLEQYLEMVRGHRTAGRTCRRARVVSEPLSEYQQWVLSFAALFVDAGEEIRYVSRPRLTSTSLPASGGILHLRRHTGHVPALRQKRHQHRIRDHRRAAYRTCLPGSIRQRPAARRPAS